MISEQSDKYNIGAMHTDITDGNVTKQAVP